MSVQKSRYLISICTLDSASFAFDSLLKKDSTRSDFPEIISKYFSVLKNCFALRQNMDFWGYGKKLRNVIIKRKNLITRALHNLLEKDILKEKAYDLLICLTDIVSESLSKEQFKHLCYLTCAIDDDGSFEKLLQGINVSNAEKILHTLKCTYDTYSNTVGEKLAPSVKKAYELAFSLLEG